MAGLNLDLMGLFPGPDELPQNIKRDEALALIRRTLEASRASIDEIANRADKVLTEDEVVRLHKLGEKLTAFAVEAAEYQGPTAL